MPPSGGTGDEVAGLVRWFTTLWFRSWSTHADESSHEDEQERREASQGRFSLAADRWTNQGARRLARRDARPPPQPDQAGRSRRDRGMEVARCSGLGARWDHLHRRNL